jgi:hypothetical protein
MTDAAGKQERAAGRAADNDEYSGQTREAAATKEAVG